MNASAQESYLKKRLQNFLLEMLRMGTLKGFKHFAMYMRGREEMVISVVNEPQTTHHGYVGEGTPGFNDLSRSGSLTSQNLPYDQRSLLISLRSQMTLSKDTTVPSGVGLPPASPSDQEINIGGENSTLFLIAGYARYCCPYVWVRSNHERLVKITGDSTADKDSPLRLKSTTNWKDLDSNIWDVIAELIKLCTYPAPLNPFEVDFDYFSSLPLQEQVLATAAMANCLQKIVLHMADDKSYSGKVFEELQLVTKQHFTLLQKLVKSGGLPVLNQHLQHSKTPYQYQHQQKQSAAKPRQRYASGEQYWKQGPPTQQSTGYNYSQY